MIIMLIIYGMQAVLLYGFLCRSGSGVSFNKDDRHALKRLVPLGGCAIAWIKVPYVEKCFSRWVYCYLCAINHLLMMLSCNYKKLV